MSAADDTTASFGFREVPEREKESLVGQVFSSVAARYDLMNDLMSLGLHRAWKRIFVNAIQPRPGETLLDLAGGTGDISFLALERGAGRVICSDINAEMLSVGQSRALKKGLARGLSFLCADAEHIPLPDASVEKVSMAFGLRNGQVSTPDAEIDKRAREVIALVGLAGMEGRGVHRPASAVEVEPDRALRARAHADARDPLRG